METMKEAVQKETKRSLEDELERLQSCIESFNKSKGKVQAFVTSSVETAETNLRGDIESSLKELKRLQKEVNSLKRSIRDDVGSDFTSIKEEVAKVTLKQSEFIPTLNSSIDTSRREVSDKMKEGLKQIEANVASRTKLVDDSLAGIKSQIKDIQTQQEEETSMQAGDIAKLFERIAELETNLLKIASRQYPYDETMLSEKVASLVNPKVEKLEGMIDFLEKSSMINIKESEVFQEAKRLVEEESASEALNISREERNRTLSEVAKKVLAVAARRGDDPSLVELSRLMQDGKIGTTGTPYHYRASQEADDSSPESQMSILTSEALSLCNVKLDDDTQTETPRPKESCPSPTPSCLDSVLNRSTPEVNGPKASKKNDVSPKEEERVGEDVDNDDAPPVPTEVLDLIVYMKVKKSEAPDTHMIVTLLPVTFN
jgi:predicted metalloprotease